jgi:EmrB/QacA subfamily drug resistance transporter
MTAVQVGARRQVAAKSVLVVAAFGAFLAFLDSTIVNVAFPSIQAAFGGTSFNHLSWVLNAYNIVFAAFLVVSGRIADLLGRRRVFLFGIALFTLASAGCAVATSVDTLIAFRVVQALGAAVLVPASLALVVEAFPPEHRAHGIGLWGAAGALAAGLGPPVGGALVQADSWRLAFLVNLPLGAVAYVVARRTLVESRAPGVRTMPDLRGAALLAFALATLTLGIVKGEDWGWASTGEYVSFGLALLATLLLVQSSRKHPAPIVDPLLVRNGQFVLSSAITLVASMGFYAYLLTHILWLHYVWQYSLLKAGLAVAPGAFVAAAVASRLGNVADRYGYRTVALPGALIWAGGFAWYIERVGTHPHFLSEWLPGQIVSGIGVGATLPIVASAALSAVPGGRYAGASAVMSAARQVGAVLGIALLVVIVGVPDATSAARVFRHGWEFTAVCFLVAACGTLLMRRGRTTIENESELDSDAPDIGAPTPRARIVQPDAEALQSHLVPEPPPVAVDGPLADVALLAGVSADVRAEIEQTAETVSVLGGEWLFHEGDAADSLYVLRSGQLEVVREGAVVQRLTRGAVLGELGVLTGSPRTASIRARRDCRLLRITTARFDELCDREPALLRAMTKTIARWMQTSRPIARNTVRPVVVSVIGLDPKAPVNDVARAIAEGLSRHASVATVSSDEANSLVRVEADHERVLLFGCEGDREWRAFCHRQADRIVYVSAQPGWPTTLDDDGERDVDLVLVGTPPEHDVAMMWHDLLSPRSVTVTPAGDPRLAATLRPLVARLAGRSIGLVLGGGGARALAHIGVLEELELAGLYVDRVAGSSFGALVGAFYGMGMTPEEIDGVCYDGLVRRNPLNDYTLPTRSLARGRKVARAIEEFFGDAYIEELPREFRAVSVDLRAREVVVHKRGRLADVIAASVRLPVLFPPYLLDGRLHVDGGVMDNLPVDALRERDEGPIIAVNISAGTPHNEHADRSARTPALLDTLMRSMMMSAGIASGSALQRAQLVITPNARGVGLLEFHQIDQMRAAGRAAAREALRGLDATLRPVGSDPASARPSRPAGHRPRPF